METQNAARSLASLIGKVAIVVVASEAAADPRRTLPMLPAVHRRMSETVAAGVRHFREFDGALVATAVYTWSRRLFDRVTRPGRLGNNADGWPLEDIR
ncbi:hypothetical protein VSR82_20135 [Burkholderia sp. JPY481]|uniref:hypothetical protein n=1 Tax=Paraburkholderia sp. JPY465 TaxID=3042285 RepID=UPI0031731034